MTFRLDSCIIVKKNIRFFSEFCVCYIILYAALTVQFSVLH